MLFRSRNLTPAENAQRTALMTTFEIVGEAFGIPGMSKIMKGVPIGQGTDAVIAAVKRSAAGLVNEEASELFTTAAQLTVDKLASYGLAQNASWDTYKQAFVDTALATAVAVGTSGSIATATRNLQTAAGVVSQEQTYSTPLKFDTVVAKDATGKGVSLIELITATSVADFSDPTANDYLSNITPTVDLRSVVPLGDINVTLGDIFNGVQSTIQATDTLSESAVAEIFRQNNLTPTDEAITRFAGSNTTSAALKDIASYTTIVATAQNDNVPLTDQQIADLSE